MYKLTPFLIGDRLHGGFGDKLAGTAGHHHLDIGTAVTQAAHQFGGLVGSNAARDAEEDVLRAHGESLALWGW